MVKDIDAELDALGQEPADLAALIAAYSEGLLSDLGNVDAVLEGLGEGGATTFTGTDNAPSTIEQPLDEAGPPSGEYSLGPEGSQTSEGIELDMSGEMSLPDERSGSYELPSAPADDGAADDPAGAMVEALNSQAPADPDTEQVELDPFVEEAEPTMVGAHPDVTQVVPTDTFVDVPTPLEGTVTEEETTLQGNEQADIDGLFDELTNPSSRPPSQGSTQEQALCADDELGGSMDERGPDDVDEDLARFAGNVTDPPARGYEDDENTAVFDAAQFRNLEDTSASDADENGLQDEVTRNASSTPPPLADAEDAVTNPPAGAKAGAKYEDSLEELSMADIDIEELEASELEVMMDDDEAETGAPPAGSMAPPPPPPSSNPNELDLAETAPKQESPEAERPSLIGRLLGRKKK